MSGVALLLGAGCRGDDAAGAAGVAPDASALPQLVIGTAPEPLTFRSGAGLVEGRTADDSLPRLVLRPRAGDDASARLCSVIAAGVRAPVALPWGMPLDTAVPRLLPASLAGTAVQGVRFVVPGASAVWVFEGVTSNGRHQVSMRWPVRSASAVAVDASEAVIDAALSPRPTVLDSILLTLRDTGGVVPRLPLSDSAALARPVARRAVPLYGDLPIHAVQLSDACPEATFAVPMIARADQLIRIPVQRGDRIDASATVEYGQMRLSFDEIAPVEGEAVGARPTATATAAADGRLTLRVVLITTPKKQRADQTVLLHLARRR